MARRKKSQHKRYFVETRYLGEQADLKRIQENVKKYRYLNHEHPLIIQLLDEEYAVVTKFGTVTFWNVKKGLARQFLKEIALFISSREKEYDYTDSVVVYAGAEEEKLTFEELFLKFLDVEKIKLISYVSAQSVALDRYENEIDDRLKEAGRVVENLKFSGRTRFSQRNLLRQVGNIMSVKQNVVSNLALVDKPEEAWESEELEKLYLALRVQYELKERFETLNDKIEFLSENNTALLNFISMQKSNFLELIIIILIAVEIVLFMPDWLPFFVDLFS